MLWHSYYFYYFTFWCVYFTISYTFLTKRKYWKLFLRYIFFLPSFFSHFTFVRAVNFIQFLFIFYFCLCALVVIAGAAVKNIYNLILSCIHVIQAILQMYVPKHVYTYYMTHTRTTWMMMMMAVAAVVVVAMVVVRQTFDELCLVSRVLFRSRIRLWTPLNSAYMVFFPVFLCTVSRGLYTLSLFDSRSFHFPPFWAFFLFPTFWRLFYSLFPILSIFHSTSLHSHSHSKNQKKKLEAKNK